MNTRNSQVWIIGLLLIALPLTASAIPQEVRDRIVSNAVPSGFEEISNSLPGQLFMMPSSNAATPFTWLSIRWLPNSLPYANIVPWRDSSNELKVVGRYSERLGNLDMDILDAEFSTNNVTLRQRSIQFSMASDLFLLDLRSPSLQTNEMDAIMRRIIKTIATQNATPPREEVQGWRNALICLLMVAMIFVVAIAKR